MRHARRNSIFQCSRLEVHGFQAKRDLGLSQMSGSANLWLGSNRIRQNAFQPDHKTGLSLKTSRFRNLSSPHSKFDCPRNRIRRCPDQSEQRCLHRQNRSQSKSCCWHVRLKPLVAVKPVQQHPTVKEAHGKTGGHSGLLTHSFLSFAGEIASMAPIDDSMRQWGAGQRLALTTVNCI